MGHTCIASTSKVLMSWPLSHHHHLLDGRLSQKLTSVMLQAKYQGLRTVSLSNILKIKVMKLCASVQKLCCCVHQGCCIPTWLKVLETPVEREHSEHYSEVLPIGHQDDLLIWKWTTSIQGFVMLDARWPHLWSLGHTVSTYYSAKDGEFASIDVATCQCAAGWAFAWY